MMENPFENSLIVSNVLNYVGNIQDLKNIRLTNSLWLKESWKVWESLAIYVITSPKPTCPCQTGHINESKYIKRTCTLQEFLLKWESANFSERKYIRRFRLSNFCLTHPPSHKESDFNKLFDLVGNQMTYLHLDRCTFHTSTYINGFNWILSKCLNLQQLIVIFETPCKKLNPVLEVEIPSPNENLKKITFMRCTKNALYYYRVPDTDYRQMLVTAPNLETFETIMLTDALLRPPESLPYCLSSLEDPRQFQGSSKALITFVQSTLPILESIKLVVDVDQEERHILEENFPRMLSACQNSLKELHVKGLRRRQGGCMSILRCLGISLRFPCLTHLTVSGETSLSITSLRGAPNLKLLHLRSPLKSNWNQLIAEEGDSPEGELTLLSNMKDLYIEYFRFLPNSLRMLKRWMPNIKELGVIVTPSTRLLVEELWPDLDKLVLIKGSVAVEGGQNLLHDLAHVGEEIN